MVLRSAAPGLLECRLINFSPPAPDMAGLLAPSKRRALGFVIIAAAGGYLVRHHAAQTARRKQRRCVVLRDSECH